MGVVTVSFEEEKECCDGRETSAPWSMYILFVICVLNFFFLQYNCVF